MLILYSCEKSELGAFKKQREALTASNVVSVRHRCYRGADKLGQTLWRKTSVLLFSLSAEFPNKEYYLKMDSDALVSNPGLHAESRYECTASLQMLPRSLLRFLQYTFSNTPRDFPIYFGNNRISSGRLFCVQPRCLLQSKPWSAFLQNQSIFSSSTRSEPYRVQDGVSYAQGGFYGFNRIALTAINTDHCMEGVAAAVDR